jgi:tripartite ATP-independent transporter DctP family solute receptor
MNLALIRRAVANTILVAFPLCIFTACGASGRSASSPASPNEPVTWRFALEEPAGSVQDAYAQQFKKLIEERSGGTIEIEVYPYGTLGTSDQLTELVRMQTLEFAMASPGHLGTLIPEVQVFLLHFIFSDDQTVIRDALRDSALMRRFNELYAAKNLQLLGLIPEGWMAWTTQKPIRRPEDFDGVKIRVMTSPLLIEVYEAYGANPTPMPYSEVYSALQLNMIDAQVNPIFAIQEMSFYEVCEYLIVANQAQFVASVVTNKAFFDLLPEDQRQLVIEVSAELHNYIFEVQETFNTERLDIIREKKPDLQIIDDLTDAERAAFREASLPVRETYVEMAGDSGREILDLLTAAVVRAEARRGSN